MWCEPCGGEGGDGRPWPRSIDLTRSVEPGGFGRVNLSLLRTFFMANCVLYFLSKYCSLNLGLEVQPCFQNGISWLCFSCFFIAVVLSSLTSPKHNSSELAYHTSFVSEGQMLWLFHCSRCHQAVQRGLSKLWVWSRDGEHVFGS